MVISKGMLERNIILGDHIKPKSALMSFPELKLLLHTFKLTQNANPNHWQVYVTNFNEEMKTPCVSDYLKKTNTS